MIALPGNYCLVTDDPRQWTLAKRGKDQKGEPVLTGKGHFTSLQGALRRYCDLKLHEGTATATTMQELLEAVQRTNTILESLDLKTVEPDPPGSRDPGPRQDPEPAVPSVKIWRLKR